MSTVIISVALAVIAALLLLIPMLFRVVVSTNEMHIVQSRKKTVSYGKGESAGNTYYRWPSWIPIWGVRTITLPVSVFDIKLENYAAYDKGRVPFVIDIMAFFRVTDSNLAAQRLLTVDELNTQLEGILQGACRTILASSEIEEILEGRATFGEKFTKEVDANLKEWGVQTVKCIELMDIRDAKDSKVIENIMAKKKSLIDMQSRVEVAANRRTAELAEVEAQQIVDVRRQEALQLVGIRTAEKDKQIGVANEQSQQSIKEQEKVTADKHMEVVRVQEVRKAEIERDVQIVSAEQVKRTTVLKAEGELEQSKLNAEGVRVEGEAKGAAEQALLMAPVNAQISLAREIGSSPGYQQYLIGIENIAKDEKVGIAQAKALEVADIKVIANAGNIVDGAKTAMEMFNSRGGTQIAGMLESIAQTPTGEALIGKFLDKKPNGSANVSEGK